VVKKNWVPGAGDIIWIDLHPGMGHEQTGKRPALVLSPSSYNSKTSLVVACAMTTQKKGYPFEVEMPDGGVVLADQVRSLDWRFRNAQPKDTAPPKVLKQVRILLGTLLQI
jgi:mRNA interferase MazF